jgi:hypothetical protein
MKIPQKQAPGETLIRLCAKLRIIDKVSDSLHIKQISHDYYLLWHETENEKERENIRREYHQEVSLALLVPFGIHAGEVAILHFMSLQWLIGLIVLIVVSIAHMNGGRLK